MNPEPCPHPDPTMQAILGQMWRRDRPVLWLQAVTLALLAAAVAVALVVSVALGHANRALESRAAIIDQISALEEHEACVTDQLAATHQKLAQLVAADDRDDRATVTRIAAEIAAVNSSSCPPLKGAP